MDWIDIAQIEFADGTKQPNARVAFGAGWLHIWGQLGIRSVPASQVSEVRWSRGAYPESSTAS